MGFPTANTTDTARAVKEYLAHGWSVIPIRPGDKRPLVPWEEYQERKPTATEWGEWLKTPAVNVALVTGEVSGVTVVDVDGDAGMASIRPVSGRIPKTLLAKSPHGWHMFFKYQAGVRNKARLLPGVDIRGDGGYVVISPSRLPDAGYRWTRTVDLQPFPQWLVKSEPGTPLGVAKTAPKASEQPKWVAAALSGGVQAGQRNAMATRLAGYLYGRGLPEDVIRATMEPYRVACIPPLDPGELDQVIRSVARYRRFAAAAGVIDPPTVQRTAAGERYMWDDVAVDVRGVSRNKTSLLAELGLTLSLPGLPETVKAPTVLNLVSQRERDGLAQSLRRQVPELDWDARIDVLCRLVLESYRRGDPAILLREARRRASSDAFALKPLLLADAPTVWFADGGTGKSLLALAASCAIAGHDVFAGLRATRPRRVLYLDWEWEDWQHAERLDQLLGEDADASDLLYRRCYGSMADEIESIRQVVADEEVEYVVIDSLGAACGGDLTDADTALRFAGHVRSLGVGSLWITHVTKHGGADPDKPFGTVYFHNSARLVWRVKRQADTDAAMMEVGFYCTKANGSSVPKPVGLRVRFENERVTIAPADLLANRELAAGLALKPRILGELRRGALSPAELATELGTTVGTIKNKLTALRSAGEVVPMGNGTWALVEVREEVVTPKRSPVTPMVTAPTVPAWFDDAPLGDM